MKHPVDERRYRSISSGKPGEGPVVYWMSRDQRIDDNWALLYAQELALRMKKPLLVLFCLTTNFLGANLRHYSFLVKGLAEVQQRLGALDIPFHLLQGDPTKDVTLFLKNQGTAAVVTDFDPLSVKRTWKEKVVSKIKIPIYEVDAHNIIPCWLTSDKQEYAAYTIRPKINRKLQEFFSEFPPVLPHPHGNSKAPEPISINMILNDVKDRTVGELTWISPGEKPAKTKMLDFINNRLAAYPKNRNNPCLNGQSGLSPYLHYGQVSAQRIALEVQRSEVPPAAKEAFLEELIIRRELADNYCFYNQTYDSFKGFPNWARKTLDEHRKDARPYTYSLEQFEQAETADDLWNACQMDLAGSGKLHGYLRMYWAKKILEWTSSPEEAQNIAIYLNDRYSLDGRDPNGYTGIAWSIGGVHDRAWPVRPVFGKIRYMSLSGCRRKFAVDSYISKVHKSSH